MDHFTYKSGALAAEDVPVEQIAATLGTPFYCYSSATMERHYQVFAAALAALPATIFYAVKANPNIAVIKTLAAQGAGADVVSAGELRRALAAGVAPQKIVFSGVGKTRDELAFAVATGILQINVESEPELRVLDEVAGEFGRRPDVAIRINPDIDAETHHKISTGRQEDKFGIEWTRVHEVFTTAESLDNINLTGLAIHIGSQLTRLKPFRDAFLRVRDMTAILRANGHEIQRLDLGGGLGIPYDQTATPAPDDYGRVVTEVLGDIGCELFFEPGRLLVGNAGILVTKVGICEARVNPAIRDRRRGDERFAAPGDVRFPARNRAGPVQRRGSRGGRCGRSGMRIR